MSQCLSLWRILQSFSAPISEEHGWGLIHQACLTLSSLSPPGLLLLDNTRHLLVSDDGLVLRESFTSPARNRTEMRSFTRAVAELGVVVYTALDFSLTEEESRSQPLRVSVDNEGKDEIVDKNILARSCQCCCIPHCRQMHHTANKMVSCVNLSPHIVMPVSMEMPYTREKHEPGNSLIRPAISLESRDEMYEMLTALETDFNIL